MQMTYAPLTENLKLGKNLNSFHCHLNLPQNIAFIQIQQNVISSELCFLWACYSLQIKRYEHKTLIKIH